MVKMKRIWCILLCLGFLLVLPAGNGFAEETEERSKAETLLAELVDLPDLSRAEIDRGTFVQLIAGLFQIGEPAAEPRLFMDVPQGGGLDNAVYAALQHGWISPAENFEPERAVTGGEALKIAVCAAGYKTPAEAEYGFPTGCYAAAKQFGILDGLQIDLNAPLPAESVAPLCYNLLRTEAASSGVGASFYRMGKPWLEQLYGIYETEGIVNACGYQNLYSDEESLSGRLEVNGEAYQYDGEAQQSLIGRKCTVFYELGENEEKIAVALCAEPGQERRIAAEDAADFTDTELYYFDADDGSERRWRLDIGCILLCNGRPAVWSEDCFDGAVGEIVGIDNDFDGRIEVILVDRCQYVVVESVDPLNKSLGGRDGASWQFQDADAELSVIAADGTAGTFYDIAKGDLVAVFAAEDQRYAEIRICSGRISGKLEAVQAAERTIVVEGETYMAAPVLFVQYESLLTPGMVGVFQLGLYGEAVTVTPQESGYVYGFLLAGAREGGPFENLSLRLISQSGKVEVYPTADRIQIDGTRVGQEELEARLLQEGTGLLIRYCTGADGRISGLDFPEENQDLAMFQELPEEDKMIYYSFPVNTVTYRSASKACSPYFNLENTLIFKVPENPADAVYAEVGGTELLVDNTGYSFEVYDLDSGGTAGAVVWKFNPKQENLTAADTSYLVQEVSVGITADGQEMRKIACWSAGTFQTLFLPYDVAVEKDNQADLESGDIFRAKLDSDGYIRAICVDLILDGEEARPNSLSNAEFQGGNVNITYQLGKVYQITGNFAYLADSKDIFGGYDYSFNGLKNYQINTSNMIRFDTVTQEIRPITREEIKTYTGYGEACNFAVLRQSRFSTNLLVVYE